MTKKKLKIAITGGIGSGKSEALQTLAEYGFNTISCDEIAKNLFNKRCVKEKLQTLFPSAVKDLEMPVDRKKIAEEVFNDKEKLKGLNAITHPLIMEDALAVANDFDGVTFIEVPLLFEGGFESSFDKVIVVVRELNARVESVKKRSAISEEDILARIKNQIDYDCADFSNYVVVENNGNLEEFKNKIIDIAKKFVE